MTRIRYETRHDETVVDTLISAAFGRELEATLVKTLRREAKPKLSLVAENNGEIIGHIFFSPMQFNPDTPLWLGLGPVAIAPAWQNKKIGSRLIQEGLEMCLRIGAHAVFVLGSSTFYPRFGFRPAMDFGLQCEYTVPAQAFMALELRKDALANVKGRVKYHPAFTLLNDV